MYLETIFSAEDIQKQLPSESKRFFQTDKEFQQLMRRTHKYPKVIDGIAQGPRTLQSLKKCNASLEEIQKCLEAYLETKRATFPRFYFLSNDELLEILSQTRDPTAVQPHLCKCFDAMARLDFKDKLEMHAMISDGAGEVVKFSEPVSAEAPSSTGCSTSSR